MSCKLIGVETGRPQEALLCSESEASATNVFCSESEASATKRPVERKSTHVMVIAIKNLMLNDIKFYIISIGIF